MKIGVTGPKSRVAVELMGRGCQPIFGDIADERAMEVACASFDAIINCAAWTDVDGAESDDEATREKVIRSNTKGPGILRCSFGGFLVHLSTSYVFDGQDGPYDEEATPNPLNFYGISKLGGEAAAGVRQPTLVVRVMDLYGVQKAKPDFVRRTLDSLHLGLQVPLPTNLMGSPTYVPHLADALLWLVKDWPVKWNGLAPNPILNIVGDGNLSRYAWGRKVAEAFGYNKALIVPSDEKWGKASRPLRGGLLVDKARRLGVPIHTPDEGLAALRKADGSDAQP
jgi:dTDP-4-dehydrorhamnose reductase